MMIIIVYDPTFWRVDFDFTYKHDTTRGKLYDDVSGLRWVGDIALQFHRSTSRHDARILTTHVVRAH